MDNEFSSEPRSPSSRSSSFDGLPFDLHSHPEKAKELISYILDELFKTETDSSYKDFYACTTGADKAALGLLESDSPEDGSPADELIHTLMSVGFKKTINLTDPNHYAYIPGSGSVAAAAVEFMSSFMNRHVGIATSAPALSQLESNVLRWFARELGFSGPNVRGVFTSGGSLANLWALVVARESKLSPDQLAKATVYCSDQVHHCLYKSMRVGAIPLENLRPVPVDENLSLRIDKLEEMLQSDKESGLFPFFVVGTAGTTNTGAIDPLAALADVCQKHKLWFHVDGAYGGFFHLTERGRMALSGMGQADSVSVDPHKSLFTPYGLGAVFVKDGLAMRKAFEVQSGAYLTSSDEASLSEDVGPWNSHDYGPELSRECRGLQAWFPLKLYGFGKYRQLLNEKLDCISELYKNLQQLSKIKVFSKPSLSILTFYIDGGGDLEVENEKTRAFYKALIKRGKVYLSPTTIQNRFIIRACILNQRTTMEHVRFPFTEIEATLKDF